MLSQKTKKPNPLAKHKPFSIFNLGLGQPQKPKAAIKSKPS